MGVFGVNKSAARLPVGKRLVARDRARRLMMAMDRLSGEHRTVLSLFAVEGLSHKEIAEILGVPEGTVWSRLNAARRRLAGELAVRHNGP